VLAHEDKEVRALLGSVNDSKQMDAASRAEAFKELTDARFEGRTVWAIAEASVAEIDETNILRASLLAMSRAVRALKVRPDCVLVDGCNRPPELLQPGERWTRGSKKDLEAERNQQKLSKWFGARSASAPAAPTPVLSPEEEDAAWRPGHVEAVIEGDGKVRSISAASVLAKEHRDRIMEKLHEEFPAYGFASHKGYGTREHLEAIKTHGVCLQHRRSFGPVREVLGLPAGKQEAESSDTPSTAAQASSSPCSPTASVEAECESTQQEVGNNEEPLPIETPRKRTRREAKGKTKADAGSEQKSSRKGSGKRAGNQDMSNKEATVGKKARLTG